MKSGWIAYGLGIFAVTAFGATLPVTRIALEGYDPAFLTFARAAIAALLAMGLLLVLQKPFFQKEWGQIFISGFFLIFTFPGFMAIAMQTVPAAHGGVILGFLPLATAFIARLIAGETPSPRFWVLSLAGAVVVTGFILVRAGSTETAASWAGYAWLVLAGLTASCGYVIFGKLSRKTSGVEIICRALVLNLPLTAAGLLLSWEETAISASPASLLALVYLGTFSMFLAFCAWNVALAMGGIARIGQLQLLQVFVTIAIAAYLVGEDIDGLTLLTAVVVTAIIAASRKA